MSSINFYKLSKILADHDQCIQWCKEHNLLASSIMCPRENCSNTLSWTRRASSRDGFEWRCSRRKCNGMASMRQNSWFSGSRLSIEKVLALTYAWVHKFTTTQAVHETSLDDESTSTETVIDWYNYCRLTSPSLAKQSTTAVATSKGSGSLAASATRPRPAFLFR